jgi:hemolysin III
MASKELPNYTKGEEIFNAVTHIVGGAFGITALVLGVIFSVIYSDGYGLFSSIVYGVSMIILYTMSTLYHFLPRGKAKRLFIDTIRAFLNRRRVFRVEDVTVG